MPLRLWINPVPDSGLNIAPSPRVVEVSSLGDGIVFGRARGVTIELPFAAISGFHARVFSRDEILLLEDLASTNGTWLGDRRLSPGVPVPLAIGEIFRIACVQIRIDGSPNLLSGESPQPEGHETLARRLVADLFSAGPPAEPTALVIETGPDVGKKLALLMLGRRYVVGRGPSCDWVLSDNDMSREHAEFVRTSDGIQIRDLGSKNGIVVGPKALSGEFSLHDGDRVQMGRSCLLVQDPEDRYLRQMEKVEGRDDGVLPPDVAESKNPAQPSRESAPKPPLPSNPNLVGRSRLPFYATVVAGTIFLGILTLSLMLAFGFWK